MSNGGGGEQLIFTDDFEYEVAEFSQWTADGKPFADPLSGPDDLLDSCCNSRMGKPKVHHGYSSQPIFTTALPCVDLDHHYRGHLEIANMGLGAALRNRNIYFSGYSQFTVGSAT